MAFASNSARARVSSVPTTATRDRCRTLTPTTTAPTIDVTPRTCLPLMPNRIGVGFRLLSLLRAQSQFVQLIVECLQTDAENLCGAGLVVARVLERHHDQPALRLFDRDAGRERQLRLVRRRRLLR